MAKNVQGVIFLRNGKVYNSREIALEKIATASTSIADGEAILARYTAEDTTVKTIVGFKYVGASASSLTLIDVEGLKGDAKALVDALRIEINDKLGTGVTSANTATAQLAALSGGTFAPGTSSSADTSVEGAKAYAYSLIGTLDYTDTAVTGSYVSEVTQSDGKIISTTKVELPSVTGQAESKKVVISVSEDKGTVSDAKGTISSSAETIVLSDNADGGINFEVNIDGASIVQDESTKKLKVADSALTQNYGDEKTIHATVDSANNTKTFSTLLQLSATTVTETNVKEQFNLVNASGETIGATIKIYKDSALLSVALLHADFSDPSNPELPTYDKATDTWTDISSPTEENLALCYAYEDVNGDLQIVAIPVGDFLRETEFASGVTWDAASGKVKGVVDGTSENFLTVGADGFKLSGVQDAIDAAVSGAVETLDADVSGNSTHVTVGVEEVDGVITAVTVSESKIADADDLAELSGKTVTEIASENGSITVTPANAAEGTKEIDLATDASKIKMSGFTVSGTSSFSGIAESDSVSQAFDKANAVITENERVTAAALNDLNDKIETVSATSEAAISGVSVNNVVVPKANKVADIQISGATSEATATNGEAIVVDVNQSTGAITLGIGYIDCGTYDD
jgi:hypothetical protein